MFAGGGARAGALRARALDGGSEDVGSRLSTVEAKLDLLITGLNIQVSTASVGTGGRHGSEPADGPGLVAETLDMPPHPRYRYAGIGHHRFEREGRKLRPKRVARPSGRTHLETRR